MIAKNATLIITHSAPDLDAIGFVYSARKVFSFEVPVECKTPTREDLHDSNVIVGDIGLQGYEDIGHNPALNNFDHHFSRADRSATFLFNNTYHALRQDIVDYIEDVDLHGGDEKSDTTLKVATIGIRVLHDGEDLVILAEGGRLLKWLEETAHEPGKMSGTLTETAQGYLKTGQEEVRLIREELKTMRRFTTSKGRTVGYLKTRSPVFSVAKEEMFALGIDIAVVYHPVKNRYSIARKALGAERINLEGIIEALNAAEWHRGLPRDQHWGGHEDRIGSPRSGSILSADEVLNIVKATL